MNFDRCFRLADKPGRGVFCGEEGLYIAGVAVLESMGLERGRRTFQPRTVEQINHDLCAHYRLPIDFSGKMAGAIVVARELGRGELAQAKIAALLLQIPEAPTPPVRSPTEALRLAKQLLCSGLLRADWDPERHPRWPPGSSDSSGGQFAPAGANVGGADTRPGIIPAQIAVPAPTIEAPAPLPPPPLPSEIAPPLIAPDVLPRSLPQNPYPSRPECVKEWEDAYKFCWSLKTRGLLGKGDYRGIGRTLRDCIMGQVSESCGGNAATA